MDIPALRARLEGYIFKIDFVGQVHEISTTIENCEVCLAEIRSSESLRIFLYFMLDMGNIMNKGYTTVEHSEKLEVKEEEIQTKIVNFSKKAKARNS